jgi:hypothetical protein
MVASMKCYVHANMAHANQAHMMTSIHVEMYRLQTSLMRHVASATHHAVDLLEAAILDFASDQTFLA